MMVFIKKKKYFDVNDIFRNKVMFHLLFLIMHTMTDMSPRCF